MVLNSKFSIHFSIKIYNQFRSNDTFRIRYEFNVKMLSDKKFLISYEKREKFSRKLSQFEIAT